MPSALYTCLIFQCKLVTIIRKQSIKINKLRSFFRFLEFEEFCKLSAKFLVDEDPEGMKKELKEAFRIYDKGPPINDVSSNCQNEMNFKKRQNMNKNYEKLIFIFDGVSIFFHLWINIRAPNVSHPLSICT